MVWVGRWHRWQETAREPSLSVFLAVQVIFLFVISPLASDSLVSHPVVNGFQVLLALISIFVIGGIGITRVVIILGFILTLATTPHESTEFLWRLAHLCGLLLFTTAVTWGIARTIFSPGDVTHHRVQGAVAVYLGLAWIFTDADSILFLFAPHAFAHVSMVPKAEFSDLLYFSFTTLTTTGYGDIVPLHPIARSLANLEAVVGQLFLATLLARLVNLHLLRRQK